jgi:hypothetical protein
MAYLSSHSSHSSHSYLAQGKQTSRSLENIFVSPGVRESWSENRIAAVLSLAIIGLIVGVIALNGFGF